MDKHSRCEWEYSTHGDSNIFVIFCALYNMTLCIISSVRRHTWKKKKSSFSEQMGEKNNRQRELLELFSTHSHCTTIKQIARHKCWSIPLIRRQVPIKVPSLTTLMMTERGVNMLHYASSLSGVTHASEFRQMDLATAPFESKSIILSPTWKKTMIKTGTLSAPKDLLFCLARNWP